MTSVPQLLGLALQHYRKGELQQAEQLYRRVLQIDPNQVEALRILALIACRIGRGDEAIGYLRAVLRLRPAWADAHNDLGMVFISQRKLPEAAASFREAVRLQPDSAAAHNNLGNILRELGQPADAALCLQEAIRLVPGYAEAHYNLGLAALAQRKLNEALVSFQQAVRLKPDYAEAHMQIGRALGTLGRHREAAAGFREVLRLQPDNAEARERALVGGDQLHVSAGCQKAPCQDTGHANGDVKIEHRADSDESVDAVGSSEAQADRAASSPPAREDAEASWEQTLHLNSDYARLHYYLGSVLERQGRSESARAHYEEVMRLEPEHEETRLRLGKMRAGWLDDAHDTLNKQRSLEPHDQHSRNSLRATNRDSRRHAGTMAEEYARWEGSHIESKSPAPCPRPMVHDKHNGRRAELDLGGSAVLDVYFGLVAGASATATDGCSPEIASAGMREQAEHTGDLHADACVP